MIKTAEELTNELIKVSNDNFDEYWQSKYATDVAHGMPGFKDEVARIYKDAWVKGASYVLSAIKETKLFQKEI